LFTEHFDFTPGALRTDRLDSGIPLFPSHYDRKSSDQLGISVSYAVEGSSVRATFKWGANASESLRADVRNGIQRYVSMGTNNYQVKRTERDGKIDYKVTDWEIKHVAFAPEPADIRCTTRSEAVVIGHSEGSDILKKLLTK
jgi:hypothetical protein